MIGLLFRLVVVLGLGLSAVAYGQQPPFQGRSGNLSARLILVQDRDAFWRAWRGPKPPRIAETNVITTVQPATALLIFSGCRAGGNGRCNVGVSYTITGPDRRPYGQPVAGAAYAGPAPAGSNLVASPAALTIKLDPGDKPGPYIIQAVVTDRVSGATVTLKRGVIGGVPRKPAA